MASIGSAHRALTFLGLIQPRRQRHQRHQRHQRQRNDNNDNATVTRPRPRPSRARAAPRGRTHEPCKQLLTPRPARTHTSPSCARRSLISGQREAGRERPSPLQRTQPIHSSNRLLLPRYRSHSWPSWDQRAAGICSPVCPRCRGCTTRAPPAPPLWRVDLRHSPNTIVGFRSRCDVRP